tara:strand:- start:277 stop:477 length:201 start_codon:yes stop_codon:yes gene_type:complete
MVEVAVAVHRSRVLLVLVLLDRATMVELVVMAVAVAVVHLLLAWLLPVTLVVTVEQVLHLLFPVVL